MTALIIGIIALVLDILGFVGVPGAAFVGFILGIVAWVVGKKALQANPADGKAKAGKILGMVVTILGLISIIVSVLMMAGIVAAVGVLSSM